MEPVFSLPYAEYEAILQFTHILKKQDGFAVFIPVSRQQEGVDFLILNYRTKQSVRVQVKSSRGYTWRTPPHLRFWYNNFTSRYRPGAADLYVFTALYPLYSTRHQVRERRRFWRTAVLVFTDSEIARLLPKIRSKSGKADKFFQFGFNVEANRSPREIIVTRGRLEGLDLTRHLLQGRVGMLKRSLT